MIGKLTSVTPPGDWVLALTWDDGATLRLDLEGVIQAHAVLAPLLDRAAFAVVRLSDDIWSLEWPCGIDFGAPQLRARAEAQVQSEAAE